MIISPAFGSEVQRLMQPTLRRKPLPPGAQVGDFRRIAKGTEVKVDQVKRQPTGGKGGVIFAHALTADGATEIGWTSTRNFRGKFVNETLGAVEPAPGADKFSPNAAWQADEFLGQITLVDIVDVTLDVERIALKTLEPYMTMVRDAAQQGVIVAINSGFRSFPEQKALFDGFQAGLPGFNPANRPGNSNHQNGVAFDISVGAGEGNPTYEWLKKNGPARGFLRTVNKEPWHWEFDPQKAQAAVAHHTFKTGNVAV